MLSPCSAHGSRIARAKSSGSNGRRSSSASPIPISLTGTPQLLGDRERDAALCGAVELGERDAGHVHRVAEQQRLAQAVLAGRGVDRQQRLVRSAGRLAGDHLAHLAQLVHQVLLCVQTAGGVADDHVVAARLGRLDRIEHHGAGVRPGLAAHHLAAGALGPQRELLGGRGAKGVPRREQHRPAELLLQVPGDLADRRGLAAAVDPDHEDHGRVLGEVDPVPVEPRGLREQLPEAAREVLAAAQLAGLGLALELLDDHRGGRSADVGVDERLLEVLEGLVVERLEHGRL